jgi:hypothetical protein
MVSSTISVDCEIMIDVRAFGLEGLAEKGGRGHRFRPGIDEGFDVTPSVQAGRNLQARTVIVCGCALRMTGRLCDGAAL